MLIRIIVHCKKNKYNKTNQQSTDEKYIPRLPKLEAAVPRRKSKERKDSRQYHGSTAIDQAFWPFSSKRTMV
jgi:hypothetical protein